MSEIEEKKAIDEAVAKFRELMESQLDRAKKIKADKRMILLRLSAQLFSHYINNCTNKNRVVNRHGFYIKIQVFLR